MIAILPRLFRMPERNKRQYSHLHPQKYLLAVNNASRKTFRWYHIGRYISEALHWTFPCQQPGKRFQQKDRPSDVYVNELQFPFLEMLKVLLPFCFYLTGDPGLSLLFLISLQCSNILPKIRGKREFSEERLNELNLHYQLKIQRVNTGFVSLI